MPPKATGGHFIDVIAGGASRNDTLAKHRYVEKNSASTPIRSADARRRAPLRDAPSSPEASGTLSTGVRHSRRRPTPSSSADNCLSARFRAAYDTRATPQTFWPKNSKRFSKAYPAEKSTLTDACKIFSIKGEPVRLVEGEVFNKITILRPQGAAALLESAAND